MPLQGEESRLPLCCVRHSKGTGTPALASSSLLFHPPTCSLGSRGVHKSIAQREGLGTSLEAEERSCLAKACSGNATMQQLITTLCPFPSACLSALWAGTGTLPKHRMTGKAVAALRDKAV